MQAPEIVLYIGTLTAALLAFAGVIWAALIQRSQGNRIEAKADTAAVVAKAAADNTQHVANGFANKTTSGIDQLLTAAQQQQLATERLQASIERLAESHGRTVGRLDHLVERFDKHVDPPGHGSAGESAE